MQVALAAVSDEASRIVEPLPSADIDVFMFQILIDRKKLFDLEQRVPEDLVRGANLVEARIAMRDGLFMQLLIGLPAVDEIQYANRTHEKHNSRKAGLFRKRQNV